MQKRLLLIAALAGAMSTIACRHGASGFVVVQADRQVSGSSVYPLAADPSRVGTYPSDTKSGAGYFYDDVLEYRVWLHPERGALPLNGQNDYCMVFAQYERAETFSKHAAGAETPIVLVRQRESINEPEPGHYVPVKEERITEWQVGWLAGSKRTANSIEEFMKHPRPAPKDDEDESNR